MIGEYFVMQPLKGLKHICRHNAVREAPGGAGARATIGWSVLPPPNGDDVPRTCGSDCKGAEGGTCVVVTSWRPHRYGTPEKRDGGAQRSRTAQII